MSRRNSDRQKRTVSRRGFLKGAAGAVAGLVAAPYVITSTALGGQGRLPASERIAMGFIGLGNQGGGHLFAGGWTYLPGGYLARGDVQVLGVCDVHRPRREGACRRVNDYYARTFGAGKYASCQAYNDFREMVARDDIDAVLMALPIHWHAMMAMTCLRAGKDVYCEKPTALTIAEAQAVREAATRYGRVYQSGTQQRCEYGGKFRTAVELIRNGRIGTLKEVYSPCPGGGHEWIKRFGPPGGVPADVDWDLWLGPAPWRPFDGLNTMNGGYGGVNWGQHHYDIIQWALDADDTGPVSIKPVKGGVGLEYANGVTVYDHVDSGRRPGEPVGGTGGGLFVGTNGRIVVDRDTLVSYPADIAKTPLGASDIRLEPLNSHSGNFLDCVRTRKQTICNASVAARASSLMILAGLGARLRRPLTWDPKAETFVNDAQANSLCSTTYRPPFRL